MTSSLVMIYNNGMTYKVLVPLDGSPQSESVLPFLRLLSSKAEVEVQLLRCFESVATIYSMPELGMAPQGFLGNERLAELSMAYLAGIQKELDSLVTSVKVDCASPASAIIARGKDADLTILASHGRSGLEGWLVGSVTTKVVRSAKGSVLVVAGPSADQPRLETIMVGLDGSSFAERALEKAAEFARLFKAKLILYRAVPMVYSIMTPEIELAEAQSDLDRLALTVPDLEVRKVVQRTAGFVDILDRAEELSADLVVLGSHGRTGLNRWLMGSVTEGVLHEAKRNVLVVH